MRHKHHRDHSSGPSQRQLRVDGLVGSLMVASVTLFGADAASAEVCDKVVGEHWRPSTGPVVALIYWDWSWISPLVPLVLLGIPAGLVSVPLVLKRIAATERASFITAIYVKWLAYAAAALAIFAGVLLLHDLFAGDEVMRAALREGCISLKANWIIAAPVAFIPLVYGWVAYRMNRFQRAAEARYRRLAVP